MSTSLHSKKESAERLGVWPRHSSTVDRTPLLPPDEAIVEDALELHRLCPPRLQRARTGLPVWHVLHDLRLACVDLLHQVRRPVERPRGECCRPQE